MPRREYHLEPGNEDARIRGLGEYDEILDPDEPYATDSYGYADGDYRQRRPGDYPRYAGEYGRRRGFPVEEDGDL